MKSNFNALDPTLGFMQYLEHIKFLEYPWWLNMKGVGMQMTEDQYFDVILSIK